MALMGAYSSVTICESNRRIYEGPIVHAVLPSGGVRRFELIAASNLIQGRDYAFWTFGGHRDLVWKVTDGELIVVEYCDAASVGKRKQTVSTVMYVMFAVILVLAGWAHQRGARLRES